MLSKIFKKNEPPAPAAAAPKQPVVPTTAQIVAQQADKTAWESKLQLALGDDAALLAVAKDCPFIDVKQAAVEALASEESLKRAEREFREHDRRVHRAAKQRLEMFVNRRVAGVSAAKLIETGSVLLHEPSIPANRLVELDRAWNALDQTLLDDKQIATYTALWTKLSQLTRERGEQQLQAKRWLAEAEPALAQLTLTCAEVAQVEAEGGPGRDALAEARAKAEAIIANAPSEQSPPTAASVKALKEAAQLASAVDERLAFLIDLRQTPEQTAPVPVPSPAEAPAVAEEAQVAVAPTESVAATESASAPIEAPKEISPAKPPAPSPAARWRALPSVADARIAAILDGRFKDWQTWKKAKPRSKRATTRSQSW
ncbi:MAG: hypothetical protein ABL931_21540 [Usitatibacteraceae bacterium]